MVESFRGIYEAVQVLCDSNSLFCFFIKKVLFSWKKKSRVSCQDTQNGVKRLEKWFRENVRMDVCVCVKNSKSVSQELLSRSNENLA